MESEGVFKEKNEGSVDETSIGYNVIDNLMLEKVSKEVPLLLAKLHRDMRGTSNASTPEELRDVTLSDVMRYWLLDFLRDMKSHCQFVALRLHKNSPRWGTLSDVFKTILALMVYRRSITVVSTNHEWFIKLPAKGNAVCSVLNLLDKCKIETRKYQRPEGLVSLEKNFQEKCRICFLEGISTCVLDDDKLRLSTKQCISFNIQSRKIAKGFGPIMHTGVVVGTQFIVYGPQQR